MPHRNHSALVSKISSDTSNYVLICEECKRPSYYPDESALKRAPQNIVVSRILKKYLQEKRTKTNESSISLISGSSANSTEVSVANCQASLHFRLAKYRNQNFDLKWCDGSTPSPAKFHCELCGYFYCATCQPVIHPPRGPLKSHKLVCLPDTNEVQNDQQLQMQTSTNRCSSPSIQQQDNERYKMNILTKDKRTNSSKFKVIFKIYYEF